METEKKPKRKPFGDLYNELVLTFDNLKEVKLFAAVCPRETEMAQDLFGWKIVFGKHQIACDNELEARFLRVFAELGWRSVKMPQDEKYLAKILPEFESLKERADRLYFERAKTIFSRKLRQEVKMKYYRKISKTYAEFKTDAPKRRTRKQVEAIR